MSCLLPTLRTGEKMSTDYYAGLDEDLAPRLQLPALIDMSFLMLIFFMVSATLQRQEADLDLHFPGFSTDASSTSQQVENMRIEIDDNGAVWMNQSIVNAGSEYTVMELLAERLHRYATVVDVSGGEPKVMIRCSGAATEQRFIDVLNACRRARIEQIHVIE